MANSERSEAPTLRRGVLRDVRVALGEMFGAKLDPKQELQIGVLFGLLGAVARSDWLVSSEEAEYTNSLMDELKLNTTARRLATEAFARGCRRELDTKLEVERFLQEFPRGSAEVERLFDSLLHLAAADARIRPGERSMLSEITTALGYELADMDVRLKRIMQ